MNIPEIKERLSILSVLSHYHLHPDKNNRLKCPFHNDKSPSFQVYPQTGTWTCFSSKCTAGSGDQIDFIMKKENISKHEAILKAKIMSGYVEPGKTPKQDNRLSESQRSETIKKAFIHFVRSLTAKPEQAIDYLLLRRLDHKTLSIGYDAGTLHKTKGIKQEQKELYQKAGLLRPDKYGRENSYYTRFRGCIVFPLLDKSGNITSLYGRHIENGHHYLEGKHKGLFPGYPDPEAEKLILSEAIIDAASLQQITEVTKEYSILSLYGTNGFTEEHRSAIKQLKKLKEVILFFDGDPSGETSAQAITEELKKLNEKLIISKVDTPQGEDINSLHIGHDPEIFSHLLESRQILHVPKEQPYSLSIENKKEAKAGQGPADTNPAGGNNLKINLKIKPDYISYETEHLQITLWGGIDISSVNRLRATLHIQPRSDSCPPGREYHSFRDTADLYSHSQTDRLVKQAGEKLEISTLSISQAITGLTTELETYRQRKREEKRKAEETVLRQGKDLFSGEQMQIARDFLRSSDLTRLTHDLFDSLGLVGQQDNATLLFFIFLTRFFKNPLHAIVMGSSGSGKTHLLQGVAGTVPRQHIHVTTSLSENTLYYTPKDFLKHKILLQEDLDGAYHALLPLRELMSNQEISRFSTKTNSRTGDSKQVYLHVEGPVCVAGATTRDKVYEDNANRSFLIQIEENPGHEQEVMQYQGKVAAGLIDQGQYEKTIALLKSCQLLIKPMEVIIPFAERLQLPPYVFKKMRTKNHYLSLVKVITLWNQKRRKRTTDKEGNTLLVSSLEDAKWANILSRESLLRKSDELGGKTRNFFEALKSYQGSNDKNDPVFYAKDIRKHFRLHPMQLKRFLDELEGRSFIKCRSRNMKTGNEYEITTWDDYRRLQDGIDALDQTLKQIEQKRSIQERLKH